MKVRLLKDLTSYDENLVAGAVGIARDCNITHNDWGSEMVELKIPGARSLPVTWNILEIIDKKFWHLRERDVKQSTTIELVTGSRGGFKWLRIYSLDKSNKSRVYTTAIKHEAEKILSIANNYDKSIDKIIK